MNITIRTFATLGRFQPQNADAYPVPEGITVADLLARLDLPAEEVKIIFVNGVHAKPETVLNEGDKVGLFPAVGGG